MRFYNLAKIAIVARFQRRHFMTNVGVQPIDVDETGARMLVSKIIAYPPKKSAVIKDGDSPHATRFQFISPCHSARKAPATVARYVRQARVNLRDTDTPCLRIASRVTHAQLPLTQQILNMGVAALRAAHKAETDQRRLPLRDDGKAFSDELFHNSRGASPSCATAFWPMRSRSARISFFPARVRRASASFMAGKCQMQNALFSHESIF